MKSIRSRGTGECGGGRGREVEVGRVSAGARGRGVVVRWGRFGSGRAGVG